MAKFYDAPATRKLSSSIIIGEEKRKKERLKLENARSMLSLEDMYECNLTPIAVPVFLREGN